MDSFLPNSYVFNSKNVLTPDKMHVSVLDKTPQGKPDIGEVAISSFFYIISLLVMVIIGHLNDVNRYLNKPEAILALKFATLPMLIGGFFLLIAFIEILIAKLRPVNRSPLNRPYDSDCQFELLPRSNLIVLQDQNDYPEHENETKSYPYQLYVRDPTKYNDLAYLGQIKNNQIRLNHDTKTSNLFTHYYDYTQKCHLANKFKDKLCFIKDPDTTDINGVSQFVLQGNGIILKIKSHKESTYQICAVKE